MCVNMLRKGTCWGKKRCDGDRIENERESGRRIWVQVFKSLGHQGALLILNLKKRLYSFWDAHTQNNKLVHSEQWV